MRLAHATYLLSTEERTTESGSDVAYLLSPLQSPGFLIAIACALTILLFLVWFLPRQRFVIDRVRYLRGRARTYAEYLPLILRLTVAATL
ncbi:MAG: hypothetical protein NUV56_03990, partial [Candidatus Uhrbacteria bacterium]|nr:hypothetical protein [Candidatus Uhrbacteria bacterium]